MNRTRGLSEAYLDESKPLYVAVGGGLGGGKRTNLDSDPPRVFIITWAQAQGVAPMGLGSFSPSFPLLAVLLESIATLLHKSPRETSSTSTYAQGPGHDCSRNGAGIGD